MSLDDPALDNEQLEFLGDAVLGLLAAETLFRRFPLSREGDLTRLRASVVSRQHLSRVGTRLGLGRWLRLGHTVEGNQGRLNAALFANALEALIAAIYLDAGPAGEGLEAARRFVEREVLEGALPAADQPAPSGTAAAAGDFKTALQECMQAGGKRAPRYRLVAESGPAHRRSFHVEVHPDGEPEALGEGHGTSKKQAQQAAAQMALERLRAGDADA